MILRRQFIALLGGAAVAWPLAARAQPPERMRRIGVLSTIADNAEHPRIGHLRRGLLDLGYSEGRNIILEIRSAGGNFDKLNGLAAELVALKPDVLLAVTLPATLAMRRETTTIPIVFVLVSDPIEAGLIKNIARPGGNISGLTLGFDYATAKRLEVFKAAVSFERLAVLINPNVPSVARRTVEEAMAAAAKLKMNIHVIEARNPEEIQSAFSEIAQARINVIFVTGDAMFYRERKRIAEMAALNGMASMFGDRANVDAGGLMSYGPSFDAPFYRAAIFVDKILKGENVADLPVEQPTKFEFLINLKTARTLGLEIPATVLALADEVIE